jgi:AraC-like DNA-binding protein
VHPTGNDCWPESLLRQNSVENVYVCGRQCEPPLLSYVVNFPRLEVPLAGCYENQIETRGGPALVRLRPGTVLFAPPNCWNLPTWKYPVQLVSLLFGRKQLGMSYVTMQGLDSPALIVKKSSLPSPLTGPLPKVLEAMVEVQTAGGPDAALLELARALLCCVRESFLHPDTRPHGSAGSLLEDMCVFLQNHYQHEVTRESVAALFGLSPSSLSRIFQHQGHMTFTSYLMHVRIDRAKHLLRSYNLKLEEVAARCGYQDAAYFCRVFRRLTKLTPAEYRAHYKLAAARAFETG